MNDPDEDRLAKLKGEREQWQQEHPKPWYL